MGAHSWQGAINYATEHYFNTAHGITSNNYYYPILVLPMLRLLPTPPKAEAI
jgi:hypothetical protein